MQSSDPVKHEIAYNYLSQPSYYGGMEGYYDFLGLFVALLRNEDGIPGGDRLNELAYFLTDRQRQALQGLATAASRLNDAEIAAGLPEEQFQAHKTRRFGQSNPEEMDVPFWRLMVQRGWNAYQGRVKYDTAYRQYMEIFSIRHDRERAGEVLAKDDEPVLPPHPGYGPPTWCFDRFGMSHTRLPDGRLLFIAGEHEDYYDPDFCIYNDVIAFDPQLRITIYGYPKEVFPPTDFHTATLVGEQIYLIGNLGYVDERQPGQTQVYRLGINSLAITPVTTTGKGPGWISRHQAEYVAARHAIRITGGQVFTQKTRRGELTDNQRTYWLNLTTLGWSSGEKGRPLLVENPPTS